MLGHLSPTTRVLLKCTCILRFIYGKKQGQNAIAHAYGRIGRWWDTYIIPQACQDMPHVYYATSTAKTRTKRHCACVLTCLQMVGHIYHTTSLPRHATCILRDIYGKNKDKTPLRMRIDVFADGGDTYIIPQACQDSPHVYYASSTAKTRTKRHCACVWTDW